MKMLKKLPVLLAFVFTIIAASCSDVAVEPVVGTDDEDEPIIIPPTPPRPRSTVVAIDTVAFS